MAQIDFFLCKEERMRLAEFIFSLSLIMVPDLEYAHKEVVTISNIEEFKKYSGENELMFLIPGNSNTNLFVFGSVKKDAKTMFFIQQRYGIPSIDFLYGGLTESLEKKITPGSISIYPFYYNKIDKKIYPSEEDKLLFKKIAAFIKKMSARVKLTKRTYWIGLKSQELCRFQNYKLVEIDGVNLAKMLILYSEENTS